MKRVASLGPFAILYDAYSHRVLILQCSSFLVLPIVIKNFACTRLQSVLPNTHAQGAARIVVNINS